MNKKNNQKMNMYAAVLQTCKEHQAAWETIPGFNAAVSELESKLSELHEMHTKHDGILAGVSAVKASFRADLCEHLFVITKALRVKGVLTNDQGLMSRNKITLSGLNGLSANALLHRVTSIANDLTLHGASLSEYGITGESIAETQVLMEEAQVKLFQTRLAIVTRKEMTQSLTEKIRIADRLIAEQLDAFIANFKSSMPSFYKRYFNARMIINYGHGSKTPPQPDDGSLT